MIENKGIEAKIPTGNIQTLRSGESGKCWSPPVTAPKAIASPTERRIFLRVFSVFFSRIVPIVKHNTPKIAVSIWRVPEKNP
jgi:hypothetical protein